MAGGAGAAGSGGGAIAGSFGKEADGIAIPAFAPDALSSLVDVSASVG